MKNKKLLIFNLIMFSLFVVIVVIGNNSWGQAYQGEKKEDKNEEIDEQVKTVPLNPTLTKRHLIMKDETDVEKFAGEELEIIELEEEIEPTDSTEEMLMQQASQTNVQSESTTNVVTYSQNRSSGTVSTSRQSSSSQIRATSNSSSEKKSSNKSGEETKTKNKAKEGNNSLIEEPAPEPLEEFVEDETPKPPENNEEPVDDVEDE